MFRRLTSRLISSYFRLATKKDWRFNNEERYQNPRLLNSVAHRLLTYLLQLIKNIEPWTANCHGDKQEGDSDGLIKF